MNTHPVKQESPQTPAFLERAGRPRLAYHLVPGALPGVVFMGGFRSDMSGSKALAMEAFCRARGQRFLRFDYSGHGLSGGDFMACTIGHWKQDALDVIDAIAPGRNLLVGSSMGGWLMLLAARERAEHIHGLVGIAAAPDFTERLIWQQFTDAQKQHMLEQGVVHVPNCYDDQAPYPLTRALVEEGRAHLLLDAPIPLTMPVRLLHGLEDKDVPWQLAVKLADALESTDVRLTLVKNGGHRLSEPSQLQSLTALAEELLTLKS